MPGFHNIAKLPGPIKQPGKEELELICREAEGYYYIGPCSESALKTVRIYPAGDEAVVVTYSKGASACYKLIDWTGMLFVSLPSSATWQWEEHHNSPEVGAVSLLTATIQGLGMPLSLAYAV